MGDILKFVIPTAPSYSINSNYNLDDFTITWENLCVTVKSKFSDNNYHVEKGFNVFTKYNNKWR